MKAHFMFRDQDVNPQPVLPRHMPALTQDLELSTLLDAMAGGDSYLRNVARNALLCGITDPDTICYRQAILQDCMRNPDIVRVIYAISIESSDNKRRNWLGIFARYPSGILRSSVMLLQMFVLLLRRLRKVADTYAPQFESEGFTTFFAMIQEELSDAYFAEIETHLKELQFRDGVLLSARLGQGNEGTGYLLRRLPDQDRTRLARTFGLFNRIFADSSPAHSFSIHPRDDHGARALEEVKDQGINLIANVLAQSADHIDGFFQALRLELGFYVGCLNLYERLQGLEAPVSFPEPLPAHERRQSFIGLYDVCLALTMQRSVVGNDLQSEGQGLFIVTGANQGGKSTFLRSIGLAQLMMQCGMFVPAISSFRASVCTGLFTHYRREEDATMSSGKLDEELGRMSALIDHIAPDALVLFNESFAATNEREGSEIARQIVSALLEHRAKVFFVTHLYEFARELHERRPESAFFLRAERQADGTRTFKLIEAGPLQTSYGHDLYEAIFENKHPPNRGDENQDGL
jgi:hypothetical protein